MVVISAVRWSAGDVVGPAKVVGVVAATGPVTIAVAVVDVVECSVYAVIGND